MTTEAVKYIISADDRATKVFQQSRESIKQNVEQVNALGNKAKASTEFVGTLASMLGGTQFGAAAGQIAGLTERVRAMGDAAKQGGLGMLAFKASMMIAVPVVAYQITTSIDNWLSGTQQWREEMQRTLEVAQQTSSFILNKANQQHERQLEIIRAAKDFNTQQQEAADYVGKLNARIDEHKNKLAAAKAEAKELKDSMFASFYTDAITAADALVSVEGDRLKALREQKSEAQKLMNVTKSELEIRKADNAARAIVDGLRQELEITKAVGRERMLLEAAKQTESSTAQKAIVNLRMQIDAEKERQALVTKRSEAEKSIVDTLMQQVVTLKDGSAAGRAIALQQQGFSEAQSKMFADFENELAQISKGTTARGTTSNQAKESRLLTGQAEMDTAKQQVAEAKRLAEINMQQKVVLDQMKKQLEMINKALQKEEVVVGP